MALQGLGCNIAPVYPDRVHSARSRASSSTSISRARGAACCTARSAASTGGVGALLLIFRPPFFGFARKPRPSVHPSRRSAAKKDAKMLDKPAMLKVAALERDQLYRPGLIRSSKKKSLASWVYPREMSVSVSN